MKYIVILCDGMADTPVPSLGGKTPMEAAHKPHIDALAAKAEVGTATSVPAGMAPGSDVANLSIIGYNPADCYTGRSPLEAANIGIELADTDVAMRCNLHIEARGENNHHLIEGVFQAFARALKMVIRRDVFKYDLPSSKGVL